MASHHVPEATAGRGTRRALREGAGSGGCEVCEGARYGAGGRRGVRKEAWRKEAEARRLGGEGDGEAMVKVSGWALPERLLR